MMSYCLLTACRAEYTGCSPVLSLEGLKVQFPASLNLILRRCANNQNRNLRWYLPLGVDPPPPSPLYGTNFQTFFYTTFFLLQLNPTYMKRILHFKNITFKSSYNWFKIDIHQQLRPLTANYLAMFKVISTTIYT